MSLEALSKALIAAVGENDEETQPKHWLDMGFPPLNKILSGSYNRGLPHGRIIEIYGPSAAGKTLLATMAMIAAQKAGGIAIFIDWERAFNLQFAVEMGLDPEFPKFIYKRSDTWESGNTAAMKIAETVRKTKAIPDEAPIVAVFDSVAAAVPKSVMFDSKGNKRGIDELTMNDTTALARVTSTTLKSVNQYVGDFDMTAIYLNQIRTKPGVVYGDPTCLRGDVMVPFVDGTSLTIKEIVEQKINKEVWSYCEESGKFEPRSITGWWDNGPLPAKEQWLHIRAVGVDTRNGVFGATVTPDHRFFTRDGWTTARDLSLSSELLAKQRTTLNGAARDFALGVLAGDATIRKIGPNRNTAQLCLQDNNDPEYMRWKAKMLSPVLGDFKEVPVKWKGGNGIRMDSSFSAELLDLFPLSRNPLDLFRQAFTPRMLALWIMDDGHLSAERDRYTVSVKRHKNDEYLDELADLLFETHGLRSRVRSREGALVFDAASSAKIAQLIAPHVPTCMERKLPEDMRGKYVESPIELSEQFVEKWVRITDIRRGSGNRGSRRYDVTVDGNHNYLVGNVSNGVLVHNCTPGGGAMEFYATTRLALGAKKIMEEIGGVKEFKGRLIGMETKKNKVSRPFQSIDLRLVYDDEGRAHFDFTTGLIEHLLDLGVLKKDGKMVVWDGKKYYTSVLAEKLDKEGNAGELVKLLPAE